VLNGAWESVYDECVRVYESASESARESASENDYWESAYCKSGRM
jgi:hypothetical protein